MTRIANIKARLAAATPGPWSADTAVRGDCVVWGPAEDQFLANIGNVVSRVMLDGQHEEQAERVAFDLEAANCTLIANAPADLAYLLKIAEAARSVFAALDEHGLSRTIVPMMALRIALEHGDGIVE